MFDENDDGSWESSQWEFWHGFVCGGGFVVAVVVVIVEVNGGSCRFVVVRRDSWLSLARGGDSLKPRANTQKITKPLCHQAEVLRHAPPYALKGVVEERSSC